MKSPLRILSVLLLLLPTILCAQSPLDTLVMRAIMVNQLFPQEKVYLHFDNTNYYLGETMWFKAYVVGTADHTQRPQSKVLYVELVAPEVYIVETKKYKLNDKGCCSGEFDLRESILSGYYTVRAYTRYMLNWGDEAIFTRTFPITMPSVADIMKSRICSTADEALSSLKTNNRPRRESTALTSIPKADIWSRECHA